MKKSFLLVLPSLLLIAGCDAPADDVSDTNATSVDGATDTTSTLPADSNAKNGATNTDASATKAATGDNAPDPSYQVASEADPSMPAGLIAALEKAQVSPPPAKPNAPKRSRIVMHTSKGRITVELNGEAAPLHAKSFLYLARLGFYNGTTFHRFADLLEGSGQGQGRIIQGGDPLSKSAKTSEYAGMGGPGYQVPRERNTLKHTKMVIAAARSQDPNSAGSQFYFTLDPVPFLDEGDGYTVFGKVVDGEDVVLKLRQGDKLNKVEVIDVSAKPTQ